MHFHPLSCWHTLKPSVCRNIISCLQHHNISYCHFCGRDLHNPPSLKHLRLRPGKSFFRLASDCSALIVCTVPSIAFIVITIRITAALSTSPINPDATAAMIRIMTRKSLYCSKKICKIVFLSLDQFIQSILFLMFSHLFIRKRF